MLWLYFVVFWLVSCSDPVEELRYTGAVLEDVKVITTRYVSHQPDTYEKDNKIIAIAKFLPDQTLDVFEQYTTYPYTSIEARPRQFWTTPNNIHIAMDGLELGLAENNLLYGNNWPLLYAKLAERGKHAKFQNNEYLADFTSSVEYENVEYPKHIITERRLEIGASSKYHEKFEYTQNKISEYAFYQNAGSFNSNINSVLFVYDGDRLVEVHEGNKTYKFYYKNGLLATSEFYVKGKVYNYRKYFYNENGLKTRAEIFNVYGEPEYTITYDYEFY